MADEFIDPLNDPRFPNRPNTPDFWRLSEISLEHDARAQEGGSDAIGQILGGMVDEPSLVYAAEQRLGNAFGLNAANVGPQLWVILIAIYTDAFAKGVDFTKRGGHRPNETGTAGEGGSL